MASRRSSRTDGQYAAVLVGIQGYAQEVPGGSWGAELSMLQEDHAEVPEAAPDEEHPGQGEGRAETGAGIMAFRPPEYAALINPIVNAFAMRCAGGASLLSAWCRHLHEPGPRDWSPRDGRCLCKKVNSDLTPTKKAVD